MVVSWVGLWSSPVSMVISRIVACGHVLGLWSFLGSWAVIMPWVGLWSCPGSVVISWVVVCGHVLGESVVIFWVCGNFLAHGAFHSVGESNQ